MKSQNSSSSPCSEECKWKFKYVDYPKGEHWYVCEVCGKEDWFAWYDTPPKRMKTYKGDEQ